MRLDQLQLMAALEGSHWWYRGLRDLLRRVLRAPRWRPGPSPAVLDAGCGAGANLRLLEELLAPGYLGGFDVDPAAVAAARCACPAAEVYSTDICDPDLRTEGLDLVLCCDVITAPGVGAAAPGLRRLAGALRGGGLMVLHVPACPWLYSAHDVAVSNCQRLTVGEVAALMARLGLEVELLSHRVCCVFPLIVAARLPRLVGAGERPVLPASDLRRQPVWLNAALLGTLAWENRLLAGGRTLPWGSSIIAVGRKRGREPAVG